MNKEIKNIIKNEKLPIGKFSYETYLGSDIYYKKDMSNGIYNITIYNRIKGTPLERLMIISALASIKRMEKIWYKDETIPFNIIGPQIESEYNLQDVQSKKVAESVLCDIRNSLNYLFEVDFLLEKKYLTEKDITNLAEYYKQTSILQSMLFQFLATIAALKKHNFKVTNFNEHLISLKRYELLQIIDIEIDVLKSSKITKLDIKNIFDFLYPNLKNKQVELEILNKLKGKEKCFVLTEDTKSSTLIEILLESNGFNLSETSILSYENCSQIVSVKLFSAFIREKYPDIEIIIHRDRDYLTNEELKKIQEKFSDLNVNLFITKGTDIESHFVDGDHIRICHPEIDKIRAENLINKAIENVKETSIGLIKKKEFGDKYKDKSSHLSESIENLYINNKFRFSQGKALYKAVISLIHKELKIKPKLVVCSEFLKTDELSTIAKKLWN